MFTKRVVISCDVDDFDRLVREKVAPLTDNPKRYKDWESIAEFEWNSAQYDCSISKSDVESNIYHEYDRKDIMEGDAYIGLHGIMVFMLEHGIIEEGEYLIDASW